MADMQAYLSPGAQAGQTNATPQMAGMLLQCPPAAIEFMTLEQPYHSFLVCGDGVRDGGPGMAGRVDEGLVRTLTSHRHGLEESEEANESSRKNHNLADGVIRHLIYSTCTVIRNRDQLNNHKFITVPPNSVLLCRMNWQKSNLLFRFVCVCVCVCVCINYCTKRAFETTRLALRLVPSYFTSSSWMMLVQPYSPLVL